MVSEEPKVVLSARYSVEQACALLGISRRTIYRYTKDGKIRCGIRRASHRRFYFGSEILRCWKGQV